MAVKIERLGKCIGSKKMKGLENALAVNISKTRKKHILKRWGVYVLEGIWRIEKNSAVTL